MATGDTNLTNLVLEGNLASATKVLGLGNSTTDVDLGTGAGNRALEIYTTSASVTGGTSVRYIYGVHAATAAGGVGHRAEFHTTATAKLGGWANALKGYFEFGASGDITGLASGICAEVKMPNSAVTGTMAVLELELVDQASTTYGTASSFIHMQVSGTKTAFDTSGTLFTLTGLTAGGGKMFDSTANTAGPQIDHTLKVKVGALTLYIPLMDNADGS